MNINARERSIYLLLLIPALVLVWGQTYERKRQEEFIFFLEYLNKEIPSSITTIHLVLDNLSVHKGKKIKAWLTNHPRFVFASPACPLFVDESS